MSRTRSAWVVAVCWAAACGSGGEGEDPPSVARDTGAPLPPVAMDAAVAEAASSPPRDAVPVSMGVAVGMACPGRSGATVPRGVTGWFPYGMFDDAGRLTNFDAAARDWMARGFDSVMFNNGRVSRDGPLLANAERLGLKVILAPTQDLSAWFRDTAAPTIDAARRAASAVVTAVRGRASLKGYNILFDAQNRDAERVDLLMKAFAELDADNPAVPLLAAGQEGVYDRARPRIFLTDASPARAVKPACNFLTSGPGAYDFVRELRQMIRIRAANTPVWLILQSHGATNNVNPTLMPTVLREPVLEEFRLQNWIAIGEGVKGIFWFMYTSLDFWPGLDRRPKDLDEVADLARRTVKLRDVLLGLEKAEDRFAAAAEADLPVQHRPYASTLAARDGRLYAVIANRSCSAQKISVTASTLRGRLRDLEAGTVHELGVPLDLRGGDGRMFELIEADAIAAFAAPVQTAVSLPNPSFDTATAGKPAVWGGPASAAWDNRMPRTGAGSLRLTGPGTGSVQAPLQLKPDTRYVLSYWVRLQTVTGTGVGAQFVQLQPNMETIPVPRSRGTAATWLQVRRSFYTSPNHQSGRLELAWDLAANDVAWIDDLTLVEEPSACE